MNDKSSNTSEFKLFSDSEQSDEDGVLVNNNLQITGPAKNIKQKNRIEERRNSVVLSTRKKANLPGKEDEKLDDSSLALINSGEIEFATEIDSEIHDEQPNMSKPSLTHNNNESDEHEEVFDDDTRNGSLVTDTEKSTTKRKLRSYGTERNSVQSAKDGKKTKMNDKSSNTSETKFLSDSEQSDEDGVLVNNNLQIASLAKNIKQKNRIEERRNSVVLSTKKKANLQGKEDEKLDDSGLALMNSEEIEFATEIDSEIHDEQPDMSKTTLTHDNNESASPAKNIKQTNRIQERRNSVILSTRKKSNLQGKEDAKLDDSGLALINSEEINFATEIDSEIHDEQPNTSKPSLTHNNNESDEHEEVFYDDTRNGSLVADTEKSATKRKLRSYGTKHEEFDESETLNKRSRGRYGLRSSAKKNSSVDKQVIDKPGPSSSKKLFETSETADENDTEDTDNEIEENAVAKTTSEEFVTNRTSILRRQNAHNRKILKILNEGSIAQLKTLHRIGPKAANMIHQYRKLHGKFASIQDLGSIAGWSARLFELFLLANNIDLD